jgi:hypothetical protein
MMELLLLFVGAKSMKAGDHHKKDAPLTESTRVTFASEETKSN